ncbi:UNVERIFIED_CONTAM: hypothetical protein BEN50_05955 [Euhalothece sp. KZN 001]
MNLFTRFPFSVSSTLSAIVIGSLAQLSIANPSAAITFTDFSSFNSTGDANQTASQASISTEETTTAATNFSGSPAVNENNLTNFLNGVNTGDLDDSLFDTVFDGSAIQRTFNFNAGDTFSFDWTFLTNESADGNNDYAFIVIDGTIERLFEIANDSGDLGASTSAYTSEASGAFSRTFSSGGSTTIGIGVVDIADSTNPSAFQVSNGQITTPVPFGVSNNIAIFVLMGGMASISWRRHRRRLKAQEILKQD